LIAQFRKKPFFKSTILKSKNENRVNKIFAGLSVVPVSTFVVSQQITLYRLDSYCETQGLLSKYRIRELDRELKL